MAAAMRGLAGLLVLLLVATGASAADRAIIVLDASGSMWGQIDGKPKLEIARETLKKVLTNIPADLELGLMAYGHREKGVCTDIELVVPPAAGTGPAISAAADKLHFLGKTPLSDAVKQAAEALRYTEEKATVILITDGIETCNADPCALGTALEQSGVDFTTHVVGFGLSREEGRQVACLAENTGGRYIQAGNENELNDALTNTVKAAPPAAAEEEAPVKVDLPPATLEAPDRAPIGSGIEVTWTGPGKKGDYIDIVPPGHEKVSDELAYAYITDKPSVKIRVPGEIGDYVLRYVWEGPDGRHVLADRPIGVVDSEVALIAPITIVAGQMFSVDWKGPDSGGDYIDIVPEGYEELQDELAYAYTRGGNPARIRAPGDAGPHQLRYILDAPEGRKLLLTIPLEVTAATATVAFPPDAGGGTDVTVFWTGPAGPGDYLDIVPAGQSEPSGEIAYYYVEQAKDGETGTLRMPGKPGQYDVRYIMESSSGRRVLATQPVNVTAPVATLEAPEAVEAGTDFSIVWTGPGSNGDYLDLVPRGQEEASGEIAYAYVDRAKAEGDHMTSHIHAPDAAGEYDMRYILAASDGRHVIARRPITVQ